MRSAAVKDILREIRRTSNRFLSIFAIVALGAGFFAGLKATSRLVAEYMGWKPLGEVLVTNIAAAGDIARAGKALARAYAMGAKLG